MTDKLPAGQQAMMRGSNGPFGFLLGIASSGVGFVFGVPERVGLGNHFEGSSEAWSQGLGCWVARNPGLEGFRASLV